MAIANFGMDLRPTSQVVQTDDERAQAQQAYFASLSAQRDAAMQASNRALDDYARARLGEAQASGVAGLGDDYLQSVRTAAAQRGSAFGTDAQRHDEFTPAGMWQGNLYALKQRELDAINSQLSYSPSFFAQQNADRSAAQKAQQSAYNTSTLGGSISGGVLPGISAQGTMDPTQQASWNTPWMQPGFGNPGSLGGLGGYKPQGATQQQNGGWGGVFNGKNNPWSIA